jgi:DNA polymerase-3 subunit epsilon
MREIVLDTETTGIDPADGHRIVEIGAIELWNHMPTGRVYHQYINPERQMPPEAFAVHGLGDEFLRNKPRFAEVAADFLAFVGMDSRLVIHNASFDMKFLNAELGWLRKPPIHIDRALDTLAMARRKFPGSPASLDALCRRFGIDNAAREKHGALLDSELLAEVYLELIGGRQPDFGLGTTPETVATGTGSTANTGTWRPGPRPAPLLSRLTEAEAEAHVAMIAAMGEKAIWRKRG